MDDNDLARLKEGVSVWNDWRFGRSGFMPDLAGANLIDANVQDANLSDANLAGADLTDANLFNADLGGANLADANMNGANLASTNLASANLTGANLSFADLTDANLYFTDLRGARLQNADLQRAVLRNATLPRAVLLSADLRHAALRSADLVEADLTGANLGGADLTQANLTGSKLTDANLSNANLSYTSLRDAALPGAILGGTVFADADLKQAEGLDRCRHRGPGILDFRTLLKSGKSLPDVFLRGCGLPDGLIAYLPSLLTAGPIQFYSVFISYSTANQDFADRLHADLQAKGVRCWFAPEDMKPGKKVHEQIDEAIRVYDRLVLILSHESMESPWVKTEIAKARRKQKAQNRHVLFPLALLPFADIQTWEQFDADLGDDAAKEIREFYVPDFSTWKSDADKYQKEFSRLLNALSSNP